jgi:hypothetical protein
MKNSQRILIGLAMMAIIMGSGTASAAYAWFQLNQQKEISVSGTAFGKDSNITIGFVSDADLTYAGLTYSATDSTSEGKKIYWCDSQEVTSDLVKYVLKANGYASDTLFPLTSGTYAKGGSFSLYEAPCYGCNFNFQEKITVQNATEVKSSYMHLGFAVKVENSGTALGAVENASVYLSGLSVTGSSSLVNSCRIHLSSTSNGLSTLVNPTSSVAGSTEVGGALDMDQDGQYDYCKDPNTGENKEFFYGQNASDLVYGEAYGETVTGADKNLVCFDNPYHTKGVLPLEKTNGLYAFAAQADYESVGTYVYKEYNATNNAVSKTDANGIGFLDMDIYMEGWDHSLVNEISGENAIGTSIGATISFATDASSAS